jgi:hypothetical protein
LSPGLHTEVLLTNQAIASTVMINKKIWWISNSHQDIHAQCSSVCWCLACTVLSSFHNFMLQKRLFKTDVCPLSQRTLKCHKTFTGQGINRLTSYETFA